MTRWTMLTLAAGALGSFTGCTGPRGADGTNGKSGVDGIDGTNGVNGKDGAAGADAENGTNGTNGSDGADGSDGSNGTDGYNGSDGTDGTDGTAAPGTHAGDGPWGVTLELLDISGGSGAAGELQIGDRPVVTFTVLDEDGAAYTLDELSGAGFQLAGPTSHYQVAVDTNDLQSVLGTSADNGDGTYTYTFNYAVPATYHAVPNDTTDLDADDGDYGGLALDDGTYTLAGWAWIDQVDVDGNAWAEGSDATEDLLVGAATVLEPRDVASADDCASCHGDTFRAHGGKFRSFATCLTCHVAGAEDLYSATDPTVTPGATIGMMSMIHKLHNAPGLVDPLELAGEATDASAVGYPDYNLYDYADIVFPQLPMAAATCDACHGSAADGDVQTSPTRYACGSCHDAISFTQANAKAADYHTGGVQLNDTNCSICHASSIGWPATVAHADPRTEVSFDPGLNVEIMSATNQDGATSFVAGDTVSIDYRVTYDDGTTAPSTLWAWSSSPDTCSRVSGGASAVVAGPSDHMEQVLVSAEPGSGGVTGSVAGSSTYDSGTGLYTYTFTTASGAVAPLPATVPDQLNGSADLGWDDWTGLDLPEGTYRVSLTVYTNLWYDPTLYCTEWTTATSGSLDILVGGATTVEPREAVNQSACESCHGLLEYHDGTAQGLDSCLSCHTPGAEDEAGDGTSIDLPKLIHKLHNSADEPYCLEAGGAASCFSVSFPRFDGGVLACTACHEDHDIWQEASHRGCVTCHDSTDTEAHAATNTDETWGEACAACHATGRIYAVDTLHAWAE